MDLDFFLKRSESPIVLLDDDSVQREDAGDPMIKGMMDKVWWVAHGNNQGVNKD